VIGVFDAHGIGGRVVVGGHAGQHLAQGILAILECPRGDVVGRDLVDRRQYEAEAEAEGTEDESVPQAWQGHRRPPRLVGRSTVVERRSVSEGFMIMRPMRWPIPRIFCANLLQRTPKTCWCS
jgi:hypothetical protein